MPALPFSHDLPARSDSVRETGNLQRETVFRAINLRFVFFTSHRFHRSLMKTITRFSIAFAMLVACAFAQPPAMPQFSADMSMTGQRMPEGMKGKIFFDKGNMRM